MLVFFFGLLLVCMLLMWMSQITGDPGKTSAVLRNLSKFRIKELSRTGKVQICLSMLCMNVWIRHAYIHMLHNEMLGL